MNTSDNEKMRAAFRRIMVSEYGVPDDDEIFGLDENAKFVDGELQDQFIFFCTALSTAHTQEVSEEAVEEIEKIAEWLDNSATLAQSDFDSPPEPQSQFDYELIQAAARLRELCSQLQAPQQQEQSGEAERRELAEHLGRAVVQLKTWIDDHGLCDHSVGICICYDRLVYQEAMEVLKRYEETSPATPTATASQETDEDAPFTLDDAIAHANGLEHQVKMLTRQRDSLELIARMVAGALEKAGFKADEVDNPADAIELLNSRLKAATASQESAPGQEVVIKYVGTTDEAPQCDKHPNDNEPRCEKLIERFRVMGADVGQGLHPYWKWAYATGFNDAKRVFKVGQTISTSTAIAAMVIEQSATIADNFDTPDGFNGAWIGDKIRKLNPAAAEAELEALMMRVAELRDQESAKGYMDAAYQVSDAAIVRRVLDEKGESDE